MNNSEEGDLYRKNTKGEFLLGFVRNLYASSRFSRAGGGGGKEKKTFSEVERKYIPLREV